MKLASVTAFAHNIADSLGSGNCLMVGMYDVPLYDDVADSRPGHIEVDFLTGATSGSHVSSKVREAIQRYVQRLPEFAENHGVDPLEIKHMVARFGTDPLHGPHFTVTVEMADGRRSIDRYVGTPGKRFSHAIRS